MTEFRPAHQVFDFAVSKWTAGTGGLEVTYVVDGGQCRQAILQGVDMPFAEGKHPVTFTAGGESHEGEIELKRRGAVFDLAARMAGHSIWGIGMVDPEFPEALLASWSWGTNEPVGIVKYVISSDEPDTIVPTYTSDLLCHQGHHDVIGGRATGLNSDGFPGRYSIVYEGVNGARYGPFGWTIHQLGTRLELTWDAGVRRIMEGFGFQDEDSGRSIVVAYWATGLKPSPWSIRSKSIAEQEVNA